MLEQLSKLWSTLDSQQRRNLLLLGGVTLAALVALTIWSGRANYGLLYSSLPPEEAGAIVEYLQTNNINYRLAQGGGTIQVDRGRIYELRLLLAQKGLPTGGAGVGFELFDKGGLPGTEFSNNINYQRALQGELARSITSLTTVRTARVHLVLPQYDLYSGEQPASAAVIIDTAGYRLSREHTQAISYLVSSAVKQLEPSQVTVINAHGDILSSPQSQEGPGGLTHQQLAAKRDYEQTLEGRLQHMLDQTVGPHNSIVQVQVSLNFDTEHTRSAIVEPVEGLGSVVSEKLTEEEYSGSTPMASGIAGISGAGLGATPGTGAEGGSYSSKEETRQYQYSRIDKEIRKAPGKIERLTIAAILDKEVEGISPKQIENLLTAAAGLDPSRGDTVIVEQLSLQAGKLAEKQTAEAEAALAKTRSGELIQTVLRYGLMLVLGVVLAGGLLMSSKQLRAFHEQAVEHGFMGASVQPQEQRVATTPSDDEAGSAEQPEAPLRPAEPEQRTDAYIEQLQSQDPAIIAQQLSRLMEDQK